MSFTKSEDVREKGASLKQFENQAINAVNQLKGVKGNLVALRAVVVTDANSCFGAAYVANVDSKITTIADLIDTIQFGS